MRSLGTVCVLAVLSVIGCSHGSDLEGGGDNFGPGEVPPPAPDNRPVTAAVTPPSRKPAYFATMQSCFCAFSLVQRSLAWVLESGPAWMR